MATTRPNASLGLSHLCVLFLSILLSHDTPRSRAALQCELSETSVFLAWVEACAEAFSRNPAATGVVFTPPSLPCLEDKLAMYSHHQQSQVSPSPPVSPSDPLVSQEDSSALCSTPELGHSICSSNHLLPRACLCPRFLLFFL